MIRGLIQRFGLLHATNHTNTPTPPLPVDKQGIIRGMTKGRILAYCSTCGAKGTAAGADPIIDKVKTNLRWGPGGRHEGVQTGTRTDERAETKHGPFA